MRAAMHEMLEEAVVAAIASVCRGNGAATPRAPTEGSAAADPVSPSDGGGSPRRKVLDDFVPEDDADAAPDVRRPLPSLRTALWEALQRAGWQLLGLLLVLAVLGARRGLPPAAQARWDFAVSAIWPSDVAATAASTGEPQPYEEQPRNVDGGGEW